MEHTEASGEEKGQGGGGGGVTLRDLTIKFLGNEVSLGILQKREEKKKKKKKKKKVKTVTKRKEKKFSWSSKFSSN